MSFVADIAVLSGLAVRSMIDLAFYLGRAQMRELSGRVKAAGASCNRRG